jgi:16S rRNA (guanine527-N7)-methyltransferase
MICVLMMEIENRKILTEGAMSFGIHLDEKTCEGFDLYLRELLRWNQKINLTAIRTEKEIVLKHFLDSLSVSPYLSNTSSLLDIGSGAGFPGIPLKIVNPPLVTTLIDSVLKKVDFQRHVIRNLGLKGIEAIHGRVQDKEILEVMGEQFEMVISRGFSDLLTFLSLSFPLLKRRGGVLAMKGKLDREEMRLLSKVEGARYHLQKTASFLLPFSSMRRSIFLFVKD